MPQILINPFDNDRLKTAKAQAMLSDLGVLPADHNQRPTFLRSHRAAAQLIDRALARVGMIGVDVERCSSNSPFLAEGANAAFGSAYLFATGGGGGSPPSQTADIRIMLRDGVYTVGGSAVALSDVLVQDLVNNGQFDPGLIVPGVGLDARESANGGSPSLNPALASYINGSATIRIVYRPKSDLGAGPAIDWFNTDPGNEWSADTGAGVNSPDTVLFTYGPANGVESGSSYGMGFGTAARSVMISVSQTHAAVVGNQYTPVALDGDEQYADAAVYGLNFYLDQMLVESIEIFSAAIPDDELANYGLAVPVVVNPVVSTSDGPYPTGSTITPAQFAEFNDTGIIYSWFADQTLIDGEAGQSLVVTDAINNYYAIHVAASKDGVSSVDHSAGDKWPYNPSWQLPISFDWVNGVYTQNGVAVAARESYRAGGPSSANGLAITANGLEQIVANTAAYWPVSIMAALIAALGGTRDIIWVMELDISDAVTASVQSGIEDTTRINFANVGVTPIGQDQVGKHTVAVTLTGLPGSTLLLLDYLTPSAGRTVIRIAMAATAGSCKFSVNGQAVVSESNGDIGGFPLIDKLVQQDFGALQDVGIGDPAWRWRKLKLLTGTISDADLRTLSTP